jgi:major vault protein
MDQQKMRDTEAMLNPGQYLFMADANGIVNVVVGPIKKQIDSANELLLFNDETQEFNKVTSVERAIRQMPIVDENSYVVLHNPAQAAEDKYPNKGETTSAIDLHIGKKINLQGPVSFALWPGQFAKVIPGHRLRTNQYLIVRVCNETAAKENWNLKVLEQGVDKEKNIEAIPESIANGQLFVVKGTDLSFYIPATGLEVIPDENGQYVRDAVTLENLEYCILKNEQGLKRYIPGPTVEFPKPDETFESKNGNRIFRGVELNENMGIYVKVTSPYDNHEIGTELFITGKDEKIYMPKPQHSIITYGKDTNFMHYAIAIPEGEARYVLDKRSGEVNLIKGPKMLMPDPRHEVIVRRILSQAQCDLWYPGNEEVRLHNLHAEAELDNNDDGASGAMTFTANSDFNNYLTEENPDIEVTRGMFSNTAKLKKETRAYKKAHDLVSDSMVRGTTFTKPRSITMTESKFEGAPKIGVWPGFAIQVIDSLGNRNVIFGPTLELLGYNDTLEILELSTGTPKNDNETLRTTYLQTTNNQISDKIFAMTKDMVDITVKVAYLVNFDKEKSEQWFTVSNYVKLLTDRCRSIIINMIKQHNIDEVNHKYMDLIRDAILGENIEGKRDGRVFENGMVIVDVDVKGLEISDEKVAALISGTQTSSVTNSLNIIKAQDDMKATKIIEESNQAIEDLQFETRKKKNANEDIEELNEKLQDIRLIEEDLKIAEKHGELEAFERDSMQAGILLKIGNERELSEIRTKEFEAQFKAIQPDLIAALKAVGEMDVAKTLAQNIPASRTALHDILDVSTLAVLKNAVKGTAAERGLAHLMEDNGTNGELKLDSQKE